MKFFTQEWLDAVKEKANADETYMKKTKGLTLRVQNLVTDCPGGVDKLLSHEFDQGKVLSSTVEEAPAPSDWRTTPYDSTQYLFRTVGTYDYYAALNRNEIDPVQGLSKGVFRIEGDMMRVLGKLGYLQNFFDLQATIPCEY